MLSYLRYSFTVLVILFPLVRSVHSQKPGSAGTGYDSDTIYATRSAGREIELGHENRYLVFKFDEPGDFRFYLEGFDKSWTPWKQTDMKEYTNLPAGRYVFRAGSRSASGEIIEIPPIRVRVFQPWYKTNTLLIFYVILGLLSVWAFYEYLNLRFARRQNLLEEIINKRTGDLIVEKEKSEALLANVLPKDLASEIMAKGKAAKIKYNFVTVLFSDIQGFTRIAEEMNPEVLIDELDKFFFHFDSVVEKYGIEKIKTIGDAYMCAGGIPEKNRTNPVEVILAALEMKAYMTRLRETSEVAGMKFWDIRIGIHTGTVIAGVVGQKKLSYDIWGDTVNTASRMESSGEAGKINISGTTYEFVKDFFTCEYRGKMPVKYKGELEMYFVNGIVPELCDENGAPGKKFFTKMQMIKLPDIEEAVLKIFDEEASPNLYFHNSVYARSLASNVDLLSTSEKVPDEEYIILKLAAIFLFTGYIYDYDKPAEASCRLAEKMLPGFGFNQQVISQVCSLIRKSYSDLRETLSDMILHDARYEYLGRVDYPKLTEKLLRERAEYGRVTGSRSWKEDQKKFLRDHDFNTRTARLLRNVTVEEQITILEKDDR